MEELTHALKEREWEAWKRYHSRSPVSWTGATAKKAHEEGFKAACHWLALPSWQSLGKAEDIVSGLLIGEMQYPGIKAKKIVQALMVADCLKKPST